MANCTDRGSASRCPLRSGIAAVLVSSLALGTPASSQRTTTYGYDALGRLTSSSSPQATATYRYDAAGNRKQVTVDTGNPTTLNGDFEAPQIGTYAYAPSAPDLTFAGPAGIAANASAWGFPPPWNGAQVAFLQSNGNVIGSVEIKAVRLVVGRRYQFVFAAAQRPGYPPNNLRIFIDGRLVWDAAPPGADRFSPHPTQSFVATQSTSIIRFESSPTPYDSASGIDSVNVQQLD